LNVIATVSIVSLLGSRVKRFGTDEWDKAWPVQRGIIPRGRRHNIIGRHRRRHLRSPQGQAPSELTLLQIDQHADQLEKCDVEGILALAERVLPPASDLWVQASLAQRQRLQQLFFPDGVVFDGKGFVRTGVSTHAFKYLIPGFAHRK
jgi:hypothetical protein